MNETPNTPADCPIDDVCAFLDRFVIFPSDEARDVTALWILHTWAFDAAHHTPYLYVNSPEKQSGKTRVIETCEVLVRTPQMASMLSVSTLFRVIESTRPTMFIDEVDTIFTGAANEDLRNVLNSGYKRNGTVLRTVPASPDDPTGGVRAFSTFAPKLLAGINNGAMPDTIADRCIFINLRRKKRDQEVERFVSRKVEEDAAILKHKIEVWIAQNMDALAIAEPKMIDELSDRAWDIAEPLLAIAERCKGWGPRARASLRALLVKEESPLSAQAQVLATARELFEEVGGDHIPSSLLAQRVNMHPRRLSGLLAPYGIKPRNTKKLGQQVKAYNRGEFEDAWDRYLP